MLSSLPEELLVQIIGYCLADLPDQYTLFDHSAGYLAPRTSLTLISKQFQRCVRDVLSGLGKLHWLSDRDGLFAEGNDPLLPSALIFHDEARYRMYQSVARSSVLVNNGAVVELSDNRNRWTYHSDLARGTETVAIDSGSESTLITLNTTDAIVSITSSDHWQEQIGNDFPCHRAAEQFSDLFQCLFNCLGVEQLLVDLLDNMPTLFGTDRPSYAAIGAVNRFRYWMSSAYRACDPITLDFFSMYPRIMLDRLEPAIMFRNDMAVSFDLILLDNQRGLLRGSSSKSKDQLRALIVCYKCLQ